LIVATGKHISHTALFDLIYILHKIDCKCNSSYILNVNFFAPGDMHIVLEGRYNYFIIFKELLAYLNISTKTTTKNNKTLELLL